MANSGSHGTLSRRTLLVRGMVATSAVVLAACGGSSGSSGTPSTLPKHGALDDTSFDLIIDPNRAVLVSGTVGGEPAAATGSLHASGTATIKGVLAGLGLIAQLTQQDQAPTSGGYQTTTHLDASVGQATTTLEGLFTLDSGYVFQSAVISGSNHGLDVHVNAMPLSGSGTGSSAVISGTFGSTPLALSADIPSGGPGSVVGTVDAHKVRFDATNGPTTTSENFRNLRVTGNYSGPADLFALIIGGITYFGA
jgi:hypothetical protein